MSVMISRLLRVTLAAVVLAALASAIWQPPPDPERQLILAGLDRSAIRDADLRDAPIEALMLLDSYGPEAFLAAKRFGQAASRLYAEFGQTKEFRESIAAFGYQQVIPVVWYFRENETLGFQAKAAIGRTIRQMGARLRGEPASAEPSALTSIERSWMAIASIHEKGPNFLGRFTVDRWGKAQVLRLREGVAVVEDLFVGNLQKVERLWKEGRDIPASDYVWAATDVALLGLIGYTAARGLAGAGFGTRLAVVEEAEAAAAAGRAPKLAAASSRLTAAMPAVFRSRVVQLGLAGFAGYLVVTHPEAFNSALAVLAKATGVPPLALQIAAWTLVLLVPLWLLATLVGPLATAAAGTLKLTDRLLNGPQTARV